MNKYLSKVENTVDRLALVGHTTSDSDPIEFILNGPENYDAFIVSVNSSSELYSVEELNLFSLLKK